MADRNIEKIRLNATLHSVRASQAVLQYGVGAMVDFPSQTNTGMIKSFAFTMNGWKNHWE